MRTERRSSIVPSAAKADVAAAVKSTAVKPTAKAVAAKTVSDTSEIKEAAPKSVERRTVVFAPPTTVWSPPKTGRVLSDEKAVYDGDTINVLGDDGVVYSVRIKNMNAPERKPEEEGWLESQQLTLKLVGGKVVDLDYGGVEDPRDSYGRLVADVSVGAKNVAFENVKAGTAPAYIIQDKGDTNDYKDLIAAQEAAKASKLGVWNQKRFQKDVVLTSFHANGRGEDDVDPNLEYLRLNVTSSKPVNLEGWTVQNAAGKVFKLPKVTVPVAHTVQIFSGVGENELDPPAAVKIYLGSKKPIWDNFNDKLTLKNPAGEVVIERTQMQPMPNFDRLDKLDSITQKQIVAFGQDVEVTYTSPKKIKVDPKDLCKDDGDTLYFPIPKTGVFKAHIAGRTLPVEITGNDEAPPGMMGVRFLGVDTPETKMRREWEGKPIYASQGQPGELAKKALDKLLASAEAVYFHPMGDRPFDTYSRLLAMVEIVDAKKHSVFANVELVRNGSGEMVQYWEPNFNKARFKTFSAASKEAVEAKRGIYDKDGPAFQRERPTDFRRRMAGRPPSRDFVADYETKLVYPHTHIESVPPHRRVYILSDKIHAALRDENMGFKMADIEAPAKKAKEAATRTRKPKAVSVRSLELAEKTKRRSS